MTSSARYLNPSEAARQLGVSIKALRLYEEGGLLEPLRTDAGWRAYSTELMRRAADIVALRNLGLSLAQVRKVLSGDPDGLELALADHQHRLEGQIGHLRQTIESVWRLREDVAQGLPWNATDLVRVAAPSSVPIVAFDLPWPWGGERFELREMRPINYIVGSLGSGKTRLAMKLAQSLPGACFIGLDRLDQPDEAFQQQLDADQSHRTRVTQTLSWLQDEGAEISGALRALVIAVESDGDGALVIDMIEQGLNEVTQTALVASLRRRGPLGRPIFALTRSCALLDLAAVGPDELILLCPANHSPPAVVAPYVGAPGYEAVSTCLASPAVRARTDGLVATLARRPD